MRVLLGLLVLSGTVLADARRDALVAGARALGDVDPDDAERVVDEALAHETPDVDAPLLVSISWGESRFRADVVTGRACGVMQVVGTDRRDCEALQDLHYGMQRGVEEILEELHDDPRVHRRLDLALLAKACGNSAFNGRCRKTAWPGWVLRRASWLRKYGRSS